MPQHKSPVIKAELSIRPCTSLRSLTIYGANPAAPALVGFLDEISSPRIEKIVLVLRRRNNPDNIASLPNFGPLDEAMRARNLSRLRKFQIIYDGTLDGDAVLDKIRHDLPYTLSRGILHLTTAQSASGW